MAPVKLKRQPEDFQVEELADFPAGRGTFALYRLTKRSMGTPEVVEAVCRRWNIARRQISYGGLKDRHALTTQFVTIDRGPRQPLKQSSFGLEYLGQAPRPFGPKDIKGNRFSVVMRDLKDDALAKSEAALAEVRRDGVPNYFDDQRFGSVGDSGDFIAQAWCRGDFERALWLALAEHNEHDRPGDREQKKLLRDRWGDWKGLKEALERSNRRSLVSFLADRPGDFKGAFARLQADMRGLYLAAFQSFLWNRLLMSVIRDVCRPGLLISLGLKTDELLFFGALEASQRQTLNGTVLPLPSGRTKIEDGPLKARIERVLGELGLELRSLRIKHPRENFFSKGERKALFQPDGLTHDAAHDELYPGRHKLTLRFDLPRGSYATILVKRVTQV